MAKKRGTGLDELFAKVFDDPDTKGAISSLHSDFGSKPEEEKIVSISSAIQKPARKLSPSPSQTPVMEETPSDNDSRDIGIESLNVNHSHGIDPMTDRGTVSGMDSGSDQMQDKRIGDGLSGRLSGRSDVVTSHGMDIMTGHNRNPVMHPGTHPRTDTNYISPRQRISSPIWMLSRQQAKVLWFLIQAGGLTQREEIANNTGVPFGTVKNVLSGLHRDGFISRPKPYVDRAYRGFSYEINRHLCEEFMRERGDKVFQENGSDYGIRPVTRPGIGPVSGPVGGPAYGPVTDNGINPVTLPENFPYSSSLESITTTKENIDIHSVLETDPELDWWHQKGLTVKQIETWMKSGNCSATSIIQSLKHFAFEMTELGRESEMEKDPSNYFFTVIKRAGFYKAPKGYKSFQERQIEYEQLILEQQAQDIQKLKELRQRRYEQQEELEFEKMMADREGELYQTCFSLLTDFEKGMKGLVFDKAMRAKFRQIREEVQSTN